MLQLTDGMLLYHGSYCEVKAPDLAKCANYKDFGKGFYLTSSKKQAREFTGTSMKKARAQEIIDGTQEYGVISVFRYHAVQGVADYIFRHADADWLHCVVGHRKADTFPSVVEEMKKYDVIGGKIANDATNVTILTYLVGAYGTVGSDEADRLCIGRLIPERLKDQFCFRTARGLQCLSYEGSERVWKN